MSDKSKKKAYIDVRMNRPTPRALDSVLESDRQKQVKLDWFVPAILISLSLQNY